MEKSSEIGGVARPGPKPPSEVDYAVALELVVIPGGDATKVFIAGTATSGNVWKQLPLRPNPGAVSTLFQAVAEWGYTPLQ